MPLIGSLIGSGFIAIPPGTQPGFDHAGFYRDSSGATRLYVAHTGADWVEVIDCAANTYLRGLPRSPGYGRVLIDLGSGLLVTSEGPRHRCASTGVPARSCWPGCGWVRPNGLASDLARGHLFSFNLGEPLGQNCAAQVIEPGQQRVIAGVCLDQ